MTIAVSVCDRVCLTLFQVYCPLIDEFNSDRDLSCSWFVPTRKSFPGRCSSVEPGTFAWFNRGLFWQRVAETVSPWGSAIPPTRRSRTRLWWEPRLCPRPHPRLLKAGLGDVLLLLLLLRRDPGGKQINSICYYSQWNLKKNEMIFCLTSINLALFVSWHENQSKNQC